MEQIYASVGTSAGTTAEGQEVIGILFPTETSHIDDIFDERFMTLAAAKELIIDLQDAVNAAIAHATKD